MVRTARQVLPVLPVTLAVTAGPLIALIYCLTQPPDAALGGFSLAQALRGGLVVLMLFPLWQARRLPLLAHRLVCPLLLLAACAVATAPASPYPYENLVFAVKLIFAVLIFASTLHFTREGRCGAGWLTACAWALLLMMALSTGAGLVTGRTVAAYGGRYATPGLLDQPSVAASLLSSALPVFVGLVPHHRSAVAGLLLLFASLFFSMCRTPLIAAAGATGGAFLLYLRAPQRRVRRRTLLATGALLLLLAGLQFGTAAGTEFRGRFQDLNPARGTGSGRYVFWRISLEHLRARPLRSQWFGEGMGSIRKVMKEQFGLPIGGHNDWLDIVHSFGLCGLVGIGWWYAALVRFAWRRRGRPDGQLQGSCAVALMLGLTSMGSGGCFEPAWALSYAALGLWAGSAEHRRRESGYELPSGGETPCRPSTSGSRLPLDPSDGEPSGARTRGCERRRRPAQNSWGGIYA